MGETRVIYVAKGQIGTGFSPAGHQNSVQTSYRVKSLVFTASSLVLFVILKPNPLVNQKGGYCFILISCWINYKA